MVRTLKDQWLALAVGVTALTALFWLELIAWWRGSPWARYRQLLLFFGWLRLEFFSLALQGLVLMNGLVASVTDQQASLFGCVASQLSPLRTLNFNQVQPILMWANALSPMSNYVKPTVSSSDHQFAYQSCRWCLLPQVYLNWIPPKFRSRLKSFIFFQWKSYKLHLVSNGVVVQYLYGRVTKITAVDDWGHHVGRWLRRCCVCRRGVKALMTAPSPLKYMEKQEFSLDSELKLEVLRNISGSGNPASKEIYCEWREWITDKAAEILDALCSIDPSSSESTESVIEDMTCPTYDECGCRPKSKSKSGSTSRSERSSKC